MGAQCAAGNDSGVERSGKLATVEPTKMTALATLGVPEQKIH